MKKLAKSIIIRILVLSTTLAIISVFFEGWNSFFYALLGFGVGIIIGLELELNYKHQKPKSLLTIVFYSIFIIIFVGVLSYWLFNNYFGFSFVIGLLLGSFVNYFIKKNSYLPG